MRVVQFRLIADLSGTAHTSSMADEVRSYFDMTPEEVYATFLNALAGLQDDAEIEGFSRQGVDQLHAALKIYRAEFRERHAGGEG